MADPFELALVVFVTMFVAVGLGTWRRVPRGGAQPPPSPPPSESPEPLKEPATEDARPVSRNLRGLVFALLALPLSSWLAFSLAWGASNKPLPVQPPGSPSSCGGSSTDTGLLWLVVIGLVALFQLGPSLVGFLLGRRKSRMGRPLPDGRTVLVFGAALAGVAALCVVVRIGMGGVRPEAFDTYGALTPPGAKGWRVEAVIDRHRAPNASFTELGQGPPLESDTRSSGSCMSMGPYEVPGLKAWIGGTPVNIAHNGHGGFQVQAITQSTVDPARRPHFDRRPRIAKGRGKSDWVLKAKQYDGSLLAVTVYTLGPGPELYLHGVEERQVGLLLGPPLGGLFVGVLLALVALGLAVVARRLAAEPGARRAAWAAAARLGGAFLLVEAALSLYGRYRIFF